MKKIQSIVMIIALFVLFSCNKEDSENDANLSLENRKEDRYKIEDSDGFTAIATHLASPLLAIAIPTYFALTENAYSKEAQIQMKDMTRSASNYYLKEGEMPPDCYETMVTTGDIEMQQAVIDSWDFECSWEYDGVQMSGTITATSTDANDAGAGKSIEYDILNNEFIGYGQGGY